MSKLFRAVVALTLVAGLSAIGGSADGQTQGASQSLYVVDVVVVGTPPAGAAIDVLIPEATDPGSRTHHVELDTTGDTPPDIVTEVGTVTRVLFVDPETDIGIDDIAYTCNLVGNATTPHPNSFCDVRATPQLPAPGPHVHAEFWGNVNQIADTTITLTFDTPPAITCAGKPVTVDLGASESPTSGADVIVGTAGPDVVNGLGGNDTICGFGSNDTLRGGDGRDRIEGGFGVDRIEGGAKGDWLYGMNGIDTILGQAGNDALDGGAQRDTCNGGTERDTGVGCEVRSNIP